MSDRPTVDPRGPTKEQALALDLRIKEALWLRGNLSWKLDKNQREIYDHFRASKSRQYVVEAGRKVGKSYLDAVIALEEAIRNPGGRVNFGAPTMKEAHEIIVPIIQILIEDAPGSVKPEWKEAAGHWLFPVQPGKNHGSSIVLFGCDNQLNADRGRGPSSIFNVIDEAAFSPVLLYTLDTVLAPQTLRTKGRTLLSSTPPVSPDHEFCTIADAARSVDAYSHRTIYDNAMMSRQEIDEYISQRAASRGMSIDDYMETSDFRREYLAQRVVDRDRAVVPGFRKIKPRSVVRHEPPPFFRRYVSLDPGGVQSAKPDLTGVLFAYHDFLAGKLVVTHELLLSKATSQEVVRRIGLIELCWQDREEDDVRRVADDPHARLCADLWAYHQLRFSPAQKDGRVEADNVMRMRVEGGDVLIDPSCVELIRQLENGIYGPDGDLARTKGSGHLDLLACLRYLVRAVDWRHNPYPPGWERLPGVHYRRPVDRPASLAESLTEGSNVGRRIKHAGRAKRRS